MRKELLRTLLWGVAFAMVACTSQDKAPLSSQASGGSSSTAGGSHTSASGGAGATGSTSVSTGGSNAAGSGGSGGGNTTVSTGGTNAPGGNSGSGGTGVSTGGTNAAGGSSPGGGGNTGVSTGGTNASGGSGSGGGGNTGVSTGGIKATGGSGAGSGGNTGVSTGGTKATGGSGAGNGGNTGATTGGTTATGGSGTGSGGTSTGGTGNGGTTGTADASTGDAGGETCPPATPRTGGKQVCGSSGDGTASGNYTYNLWSDGVGSGCMTVYGVDATFKATWTNVGDWIARVGLAFDKTKTYDQIGTFSSDFAYTMTGITTGGFGNIGIYGWSVNPLHEYYIAENWLGKKPNFTKVGTFTIDGEGTYDIMTNQQKNAANITGTAQDFVQFWSVRQTPRQCGHISISKHFDEWASLGLQLGKLEETRILVEGQNNSGTIDFTTATVIAK